MHCVLKKKVIAKSPHIEQYRSSLYKHSLSLLHLVMLELRLSGATLDKMVQSSNTLLYANRNSYGTDVCLQKNELASADGPTSLKADEGFEKMSKAS